MTQLDDKIVRLIKILRFISFTVIYIKVQIHVD